MRILILLALVGGICGCALSTIATTTYTGNMEYSTDNVNYVSENCQTFCNNVKANVNASTCTNDCEASIASDVQLMNDVNLTTPEYYYPAINTVTNAQ